MIRKGDLAVAWQDMQGQGGKETLTALHSSWLQRLLNHFTTPPPTQSRAIYACWLLVDEPSVVIRTSFNE